MLNLIIDHCDRYCGGGVLMKLWYLIVLWSSIHIIVVGIFVRSLVLLAIFMSTPFWLGKASLGVYLGLSS